MNVVCILVRLNINCDVLIFSVSKNVRFMKDKPSGLRPPNKIASIGTPRGLSHSASIIGHWFAGVQNLFKQNNTRANWWQPTGPTHPHTHRQQRC